MNTTDTDTSGISTLNSNQVTLPSGTYRVSASCPFIGVTSQVQIRIYNATSGLALLTGQNNYGATSTTATTCSVVGEFVLSIQSAISLQYQVTSGVSTNGLGIQTSFGTEVYSVAEFTKVA